MDSIKGIDIDPFAVQATQLGMFLDLYRMPEVWSKIAPEGHFDFGKFIKVSDYLDLDLFSEFKGFEPNIIIGNPPYGIKVRKELTERFELGSNDSYGCFVAKALKQLPDQGLLLFILSNTFLTNRSHIELRQKIHTLSKIKSVYQLHRSIFSGRDVFSCILELEKYIESKNHNKYDFINTWSVHPKNDLYLKTLNAWTNSKVAPLYKKFPSQIGYEKIPQNLLKLRFMPPSTKEVEKSRTRHVKNCVDRNLFKNCIFPIFSGSPTIYILTSDQDSLQNIEECELNFPSIGFIKGLNFTINQKKIGIVKLWQVADAKQGLATADDARFIKKTKGIEPNARRNFIEDVSEKTIVSRAELSNMSESQKKNGFSVLDPKRDKYFVPFDSGGESDINAGLLNAYWSDVNYWIDWSEESVGVLNERNKWPPGTNKKPRLNNFNDYFKPGIVGTITGLYAPTYRKGFGGVFGQKANLIVPFSENEKLVDYLLILLSSKLMRYISKNYISSSVDFSTENFRHLPIAVPDENQIMESSSLCQKIIKTRSRGESIEKILNLEAEADKLVYKIYKIDEDLVLEVDNWFKRQYPNLGRQKVGLETTNLDFL